MVTLDAAAGVIASRWEGEFSDTEAHAVVFRHGRLVHNPFGVGSPTKVFHMLTLDPERIDGQRLTGFIQGLDAAQPV